MKNVCQPCKKIPRVINIRIFTPYPFSELYLKILLESSYERVESMNEMRAIVGVHDTTKKLYDIWSEVSSLLISEVVKNILNFIPI